MQQVPTECCLARGPAGETPSPEMVAASGEKERLSQLRTVVWFVILAALLLVTNLMHPTIRSAFGPGRAQIDMPPEVLAFRDPLKRFG